ncbi:MAG: NAD(P)/FAD-dependent oxidoreductase [Blastocatellia bacterium]|nr:NAD(P)/FAD-dependent oxidoreductase [Blastocatellia bacterium]
MGNHHFQIVIIGSGFSGLGAAIRLKQAGFEDMVIFEKASGLGGTWWANTYPGCACDVQSNLYSFSFAPNPSWSRKYSSQPEILAYLQTCAERFGILPLIRFEHQVTKLQWDSIQQCWHLETTKGIFTARVVVGGFGPLHVPALPNLTGIASFAGEAFHSAQWNQHFDLTDKRVAVIGTGASAIQFVPQIQPKVRQLYLFQRTPPWIMPRHDRALSLRERKVFAAFPWLQKLLRLKTYILNEILVVCFRKPAVMRWLHGMALRHLEKSVADPHLRDQLTPDYAMGCKRILISNEYLPAVGKLNVALVTTPIREVSPQGIITTDGTEWQVDAILYGTGFQVANPPWGKFIWGKQGQSLEEVWQGSPKAHLGTMVAGFPNLFFLLGPNTGLGHNSVVYMIESQINHLVKVLGFMRQHQLAEIEPRTEAQGTYVSNLDSMMAGTVWTAGGCRSWYLDETGRNSTLWPGYTWQYRRRLGKFRPHEYLFNYPLPTNPTPVW